MAIAGRRQVNVIQVNAIQVNIFTEDVVPPDRKAEPWLCPSCCGMGGVAQRAIGLKI